MRGPIPDATSRTSLASHRMPKLDPKHAPRPPEADDLTVQYFVPRELLQQLAAKDEAAAGRPSLDSMQDEQTLLMLPTEAAKAIATAPPPVHAPAARPAPPVELPRVAPPAVAPRPMTPVNITDEELQALLGPRRRARVFGVVLLVVVAAGVAAVALASR